MRLDYGTQISPIPITLSVGEINKPTLREISKITFDKFSYYQFLIRMTPEIFYTNLKKENGGQEYWNSLAKEEKDKITIYDIICKDEILCNMYLEVLNFFFVETVILKEGLLIVLKNKYINETDDILPENINGIIYKEQFQEIIDTIRQICCIYNEKENIEECKFKNKLAQKLTEKMLKSKSKKQDKADINLTLPNIISAVCGKHPSLNYTNIWELTVFQLLDTFNRIQNNSIYDMDSLRVSVWGDEKKTFDFSLWYKNEYDKK